MADTFETLLEKKGRGRSAFAISRPWAVRTFKLTGQTLQYFDVDKLKGSVDVRDGVCKIVSSEEADNKPFPFELDVGKEKLLMNAPNDAVRKKCMDIYSLAAKDPNWAAYTRASVNRVTIQIEKEKQVDELQSSQKKLEEERLRQQTVEAASILQGNAAIQKDKNAAAEAERKQQEEQVSYLVVVCSISCLIVSISL